MGPSSTKGATSPSRRRPAVKVVVFQCPKGALASKRSPRRHRPRRRTILVEAPVSSIKTSLSGSKLAWLAFQASRAWATSARSCSAACRVFFEAEFVALDKAINGAAGGFLAQLCLNPLRQFFEAQVRLRLDQRQKPGRVRLQRRAALALTRRGRGAAGLV